MQIMICMKKCKVSEMVKVRVNTKNFLIVNNFKRKNSAQYDK